MRYKHPKSATHANGIYGGIGTRPAHEAWTPSEQGKSETKEQVPKALRRLRIRRTRPRPTYSDKAHLGPEFFVLVVCTVFAVIVVLIGIGVLDWRLK